MASAKVQATRDYRLFVRNAENRKTDMKKHRNLAESLKKYGFLRSFPLSVVRLDSGKMMIKDGQHRVEIAEQLGIPVYYVEETVDYDVAEVNTTQKGWKLKDYLEVQAVNGSDDAKEALEFAEFHKVPHGLACALLLGVTGISNAYDKVVNGEFKVKDREYASKVLATYKPLAGMCKQMKNARYLEACMACCRVNGFDPDRLIGGAKRCREKLASYSNRDSYLGMMEELYNYNRKTLVPLKIQAITAMRERNPGSRGKAGPTDERSAG